MGDDPVLKPCRLAQKPIVATTQQPQATTSLAWGFPFYDNASAPSADYLLAGSIALRRHNCCERLRRCLDLRGVDVRYVTSSAFKDIEVGQVPKSRRCSGEPHNLSAAWAKRRRWRVFTGVFVGHGRKRSLNRNVARRQTGGSKRRSVSEVTAN